jgi:hypothetical protein
MAAARVPVFLLDEHQVVRPGELGTSDDIERHAAQLGLPVHRVDLDLQFRVVAVPHTSSGSSDCSA